MDDKLKEILLEMVDQIERQRLAALTQNKIMQSHNRSLLDLNKRVLLLEQMLLKEDAK